MYSVAERQMSTNGRRAQWYPFGNSGWGTSQHTEVIRHYVLDYRPDVVILLFVPTDPFDCSPYLVQIVPQSPMYWLSGDGELRFRPRPIGSRPGLAEWHCRLRHFGISFRSGMISNGIRRCGRSADYH